jgi:ribosomal protein S18 acetylase RimI-like enzyme
MPSSDIQIRPATQDDSASLAILNDAATRRLVSHVWGQAAAVGQSPFEVGRSLIAGRKDHFSHFSNWQVLEHEGRLAAGFNSCRLPVADASAPPPAAPVPAALVPLNELKTVAGGSWYIVAISVFPEFRGRGLARPAGLGRGPGPGPGHRAAHPDGGQLQPAGAPPL